MNEDGRTANERWYLACTALWAERLRRGLPAGVTHAPVGDIDFAERALGLRAGARVLDLGCSWGRTTLELARRGYDVSGFDLSPQLLAIARERAAAAGLSIRFFEGTVRDLPALHRFDAICAFYDDSLISFEDEADNLRALHGVARLLRSGGRLLFGTTDCPLLLPSCQRSLRREGNYEIIEVINFDRATMTGVSRMTYRRDGSAQTHTRTRRHYRPAEVGTLLQGAGLRLLDVWNAYDTDLPYGSRPQGMVIAAERAAGGPS